LATFGAQQAQVINTDYTTLDLDRIDGQTAFIGNPPYVRHHELTAQQKAWAKAAARTAGLTISGLAGLHVYFFLATLKHARQGDAGCFITSAEWLDVGYGSSLRAALTDGLGGVSMHLLNPHAVTFTDAMTTAVITCFEPGRPSPLVRIRSVNSAAELGDLGSGVQFVVTRSQLQSATRWTPLFQPPRRARPDAQVPLGAAVRVSRGAVTGSNGFFVLDRREAQQLGLTRYTSPALTKAQEIFTADGVVRMNAARRLLLDPPKNVRLDAATHRRLKEYLALGEATGVADGYVCQHRTPWWHVGGRQPPVVATYMARQPPAFALNPDGLTILNVLHGLYPRVELDQEQLLGLVQYLNAHRADLHGAGRTYQGGLEKFEPSEMEAILIPPTDRLRDWAGN
jgi:adenine-specific DNA-methyltransferase